MSYPPKHVVNKIGKYNRANTPDFPVFYGTDSIDNALLELRPEAGRLVSIGQWIPKKGEQVKLNSYPIYHNPMLVNINQTARDGYFAFQEIKKKGHPLLMEFMEVYFSFISVEFAKPVKNHIEYLYSALFAQRIFLVENDPLPEYNFDCLIYPSVGNTYQVENLAIKPNIIDEKFRLFKVFEFEITKTYYEKTPPRYHPEEITVVEYQNYEVTDWVEKDGYIVW